MSTPRKDKPPATFEAAMERLEAIVEEMENAELPLDQVLERHEEGTRLRAFCEAKLREAEGRLEKLQPGPDGEPVTEPIDRGEA
jgi:exodeoxyribonuclease VII small subunit